MPAAPFGTLSNFYPRYPRGERLPAVRSPDRYRSFLSTLPAWRATYGGVFFMADLKNFYPRSPRGERLYGIDISDTKIGISIHAPRVGSDLPTSSRRWTPSSFLSTLPAWGATPETRVVLS